MVDYTCLNHLFVPNTDKNPRYYIAIEMKKRQTELTKEEKLLLDKIISEYNQNYQHLRLHLLEVFVLKKGAFEAFKKEIIQNGSIFSPNQLKLPRLLMNQSLTEKILSYRV